MCGRYVTTAQVSKTKKLVKSVINVNDLNNYNAHPQQYLPVMKKYINGNTLENYKWGLLPKWIKNKTFKPLINARLETINEKKTFKNLIKLNRCIVVADGFYEWKRYRDSKIPYYFFRKDLKNIYFAAIYENNEFCIITEKASENINTIHHRQPVILNENDINKYLNIETEGSRFLQNCNKPIIDFYQVSKDVNNPKNNNNSLIQKI